MKANGCQISRSKRTKATRSPSSQIRVKATRKKPNNDPIILLSLPTINLSLHSLVYDRVYNCNYLQKLYDEKLIQPRKASFEAAGKGQGRGIPESGS